MNRFQSGAAMAILAGIVAFLALPLFLGRSRASLASLALGTDDAFCTSGLEPRENQVGGGAIRWMRPKATCTFADLGAGQVDIDLVVRDHRTEVTVLANGARIGTLSPGQGHFATQIRLSGTNLVLGIETEGFAASSRTLGTQFVSLKVQPVQSSNSETAAVSLRLGLALAVILVVACLVQARSGLSFVAAVLPPAGFLLMVLPAGLWRSGWLFECAACLIAVTLACVLVAMRAKGSAPARVALQAALFLALVVQGVLPPSPLVIQSDAQLHGNKLAEVAKGNRFPTSRTDHKPPFEFPYGFSFYAVLSPFVTPEVSNVRVVREGAAFFASLSALALALLVSRTSAGLAAVATILWTFAPVNIRTAAFGNLSNVFAQSIFVLFLVGAGWMRRGLRRAGLLTCLVALSATAHLSSFIVLLALLLVSFFVATDRQGTAFKPLIAGVALAASYYACFFPMILAQVPRLLGERGGSAGVFDPWRLPGQILSGAGWPLVALLILSLLVGRERFPLPIGRSLVVTGLLLALVALVSPVEVRYLFAALPVLAIVAASVFERDDGPGFPRPNLTNVVDLPGLRALGSERVLWPLSMGLVLAAMVHGTRVLLEILPFAGR